MRERRPETPPLAAEGALWRGTQMESMGAPPFCGAWHLLRPLLGVASLWPQPSTSSLTLLRFPKPCPGINSACSKVNRQHPLLAAGWPKQPSEPVWEAGARPSAAAGPFPVMQDLSRGPVGGQLGLAAGGGGRGSLLQPAACPSPPRQENSPGDRGPLGGRKWD